MKKNVILAVVLSTIVVIGSLALQSYVFSKNKDAETESLAAELNDESKNENSTDVADSGNSEENSKSSEKEVKLNTVSENENDIPSKVNVNYVKIYKFKTNYAEIALTNQGGDLVSYQLNDKNDKYTGNHVQLVDFSSDSEERVVEVDGIKYLNDNRACSVMFDVDEDDIYDTPSLSIENRIFDVEENNEEKSISFYTTFRKNGKSFKFTKKYTFVDDEYMFKLDLTVQPLESVDKELSYTIRTAPKIGPHYNPKNDRNEKREFIGYDGDDDTSHNMGSWNEGYCGIGGNYNSKWVSMAGKYFITFMIPYGDVAGKISDSWYTTRNNDGEALNNQAIIRRSSISLKDGKSTTDTYYLYFGPRTESELKKYKYPKTNSWDIHNLDLTEAAPSSWLGWLETVLKWILIVINKVVQNWGVAIIVMTLLIKLLMFPFTKKQSLSTIKMKELQPKIQEIQLKFKDNPQKMQQQMAKLYKESGYNPLSGCLPLIVQFFILFAMYNLFNNYFEFYGSSFIPGWINDLSSGDSLCELSFNIPFLGNQIRLLPIIYLASQLLYGKITGTGSAGGVSNVQMKIMMYGMPIIFFFIFYNFPSGLILYWTVSNIFQMVQQVIINQMMKKKMQESAIAKK